MKKLSYYFTIFFIIFFLIIKVETQVNSNDKSGLPKIIRTKAGIINYFKTLISLNKIIVGQHCSDNGIYNTSGIYEVYFENLYRSTGKYPTLLGNDYGIKANVNYSAINQILIKHWKAGGLVTLSWHADCPWFDGYNMRWNSIMFKSVINFTKLIKSAPESLERTSYRKELMAVGGALKELKEAGVIVLWRPFHEMNHAGFWWGVNDIKNPTNQEAYELLWRDMYATFTKELKLDNLIWIYSVNFSSKWSSPVDSMYPGSDVVDIVGMDIYTKVPSFSDYKDLKKLSKPIVISEIGPNQESYGTYDELEIIKTFRGKAAYFLQWHSWEGAKVAIIDNLNFTEMMHDSSAITLDELKKCIIR